MTNNYTTKAFNVTVTRSRSNIVTFNNDRGVFFSLGYLALPSIFFYDGLPLVLAIQLGFQGFEGHNGGFSEWYPFI